jgi:hypothetical protein
MLHRAACGTINSSRRENWTTGAYMKVCASNLDELRGWAADEIGGSLRSCGLCKPLGDLPVHEGWWARLRRHFGALGRAGFGWARIKIVIEFTAALFAVLGGIAAFLQWLL